MLILIDVCFQKFFYTLIVTVKLSKNECKNRKEELHKLRLSLGETEMTLISSKQLSAVYSVQFSKLLYNITVFKKDLKCWPISYQVYNWRSGSVQATRNP